jgi:hypothetical protein
LGRFGAKPLHPDGLQSHWDLGGQPYSNNYSFKIQKKYSISNLNQGFLHSFFYNFL